jgi:hypothetical protein
MIATVDLNWVCILFGVLVRLRESLCWWISLVVYLLMIAHSSIVMMLKLGDILSVSGPKLMSQGLWVLRLLGVVIGVGMMELGTSCIRHAGGITRILLICLHCVHVIVRILKLWLIEMMMWKPVLIYHTNIRKVLTLAVIRTRLVWLVKIWAALQLAIP